MKNLLLLFLFLPIIHSCNKTENPVGTAYRITKNISYNGVSVNVVIDKPQNDVVDVLIVYHGTVAFDNKILDAANNSREAI